MISWLAYATFITSLRPDWSGVRVKFDRPAAGQEIAA